MDFEKKGYYLKIDVTIKKIRSAYQKSFDDAQLDLTVDQWVVIDNICRNPGISQIALAEKVFKDPPTLTRILDLMAKKNYLYRQMPEDDRRKFNIYPTEQGKTVWEKALPLAIEARHKGWVGLSEQDYTDFYRILEKIFENFS